MSSEDDELAWVSWFCCLKGLIFWFSFFPFPSRAFFNFCLAGNEFFCEVDEDYIQDDFNLTGLRNMVPHYDYALDLIVDTETEEVLNEEQQEVIESAAEVLYGLIHARFIVTTRGLASMVHSLSFCFSWSLILWFFSMSFSCPFPFPPLFFPFFPFPPLFPFFSFLIFQLEKYENVDFGRCPRALCQVSFLVFSLFLFSLFLSSF